MKLLSGHKRHAKNIPEVRSIVKFPKPPRHLGKEAKRAWKRFGPVLAATKILNGLDLLAFEQLCGSYGELREAEIKIHEDGPVIPDKKGSLKTNPWLRVRNGARATFLKLCSQFGMNPDSRGKINWTPRESNDEEGKLLGGDWPIVERRNKWNDYD